MMGKLAVLICGMLVIFSFVPVVYSTTLLDTFEKNDFPFDVRLDIKLTTKNNLTIPIHTHRGILPSLLFNFIDIRSFSIYEDTGTPDFLYASMEVTSLKFIEYRYVYVIYWTYKGTDYYAATYIHSIGDYTCLFCGYWDNGCNYHHTIVEGDILEQENSINWKIPKNLIGNPISGDDLTDIHAGTFLYYQKDCGAPRQLRLDSDHAGPLLDNEYSYNIQL